MREKSSLFCRGYNQKFFFDYLIFKSHLQWKTDLINVNCPRNLGMLPGNIDNIWINVSVNLGNMPMILGTLYIFLGQFVVLLPDMLKKMSNERSSWSLRWVVWVNGWVDGLVNFKLKLIEHLSIASVHLGGWGSEQKCWHSWCWGGGGGSLIKCWQCWHLEVEGWESWGLEHKSK